MANTIGNKAKERYAQVRRIVEEMGEETFTGQDIYTKVVGHTYPHVATTINQLEANNLIERAGRRERESGGVSIVVYRKVQKEAESRFEPGLCGGVWSDLYMLPKPVPHGRVFMMERK